MNPIVTKKSCESFDIAIKIRIAYIATAIKQVTKVAPITFMIFYFDDKNGVINFSTIFTERLMRIEIIIV